MKRWTSTWTAMLVCRVPRAYRYRPGTDFTGSGSVRDFQRDRAGQVRTRAHRRSTCRRLMPR
mgnify:CR=1 FL=1